MENPFCRMCAATKTLDKLLDLDADMELRQEITLKLQALNIDCVNLSRHGCFPITVCIICYQSLNDACDFVDQLTNAQTVLSKVYSCKELDTNKDTVLKENHAEYKSELFYSDDGREYVKPEESCEDSWSTYLWKCSLCNKDCGSIVYLRDHSLKEHNSCPAFSCGDCPDNFKLFDQFIEHVRKHRSYLRNYCKYCNILITKTHCQNHEIEHEKTCLVCSYCGETFSDDVSLSVLTLHKTTARQISSREKSLKKEINYSEESLSSLDDGLPLAQNQKVNTWKDYPWTCRLCKEVFRNLQMLRTHSKTAHHRCAAIQCIACTKSLNINTIKYFTKHVINHEPNLSKVCFYCNQEQSSKDVLNCHIKDEHLHGKHQCSFCGELFKCKQNLQEHLDQFSPTNLKLQIRATQKQMNKLKPKNTMDSQTCKICNKVCGNKYTLHNHMRIHLELKTFVCDKCGRSFCKKRRFNYHILSVHEKKKQFECKICKKTFLQKDILQKHVVSHFKEKPYSCKDCGKSFKLKQLYNKHITIHSGVKPFACTHCNKTFRLKYYLKRHEIIHTGLKPYSCKVCGVAYANQENCYNHMKKKHNITAQKKVIELSNTAVNEDIERWKKSVLKRK